jgi:transposase
MSRRIRILYVTHTDFFINPFTFKELNNHAIMNRAMATMRFHVFKERFASKAAEHAAKLQLIPAWYTSIPKTCSSCAFIKRNLGSNQVYDCNACGSHMGRDVNAAKNMLLGLRGLVEHCGIATDHTGGGGRKRARNVVGI